MRRRPAVMRWRRSATNTGVGVARADRVTTRSSVKTLRHDHLCTSARRERASGSASASTAVERLAARDTTCGSATSAPSSSISVPACEHARAAPVRHTGVEQGVAQLAVDAARNHSDSWNTASQAWWNSTPRPRLAVGRANRTGAMAARSGQHAPDQEVGGRIASIGLERGRDVPDQVHRRRVPTPVTVIVLRGDPRPGLVPSSPHDPARTSPSDCRRWSGRRSSTDRRGPIRGRGGDRTLPRSRPRRRSPAGSPARGRCVRVQAASGRSGRP